MKIYRLILLEGKLWGHPSQLCLKPGKHPNCKRQIGIFFHLSLRSTGNLELSLFSQKVGQKITISIARNESKGVYWERLHLMSLVDGRFGSVLKSPLFYPFYWHEKYDSESSLFFENELTHLPEYDTFYFWVPAGIYRAETTVISTLRTYEWEQTIIGGVSRWNSQIMRLDPYSPTLMPHSHSFTLHSYLLFPYICSLESVRSVFLHLPSSRHTNKTQWQPFLFTELSSPEFMMYLPSLVFTACWILLLSLASSHF